MFRLRIVPFWTMVVLVFSLLIGFQNCSEKNLTNNQPSYSIPTSTSSSSQTSQGDSNSTNQSTSNGVGGLTVDSFTTLTAQHANCVQGFEVSGACSAAIHRTCQSLGKLSGFGPSDYNGDQVIYTCITPESGRLYARAQWVTLQQYHAGCGVNYLGVSADCNAAISRFCISQGFATGYGPVEQNVDGADFVCVNFSSGHLFSLSYTDAQTYNSGCTGPAKAASGECNSAISHFCQAIGDYAAGFGAVESNATVMGVFCVTRKHGS